MNFLPKIVKFSPVIVGIVGKSSWEILFNKIVLVFVLTRRFPFINSKLTNISPCRIENKEDKISPRTATVPSFSTFAGISISIPIFKFVALILSVLFVATQRTEPRTGRVKFFPVILRLVLF